MHHASSFNVKNWCRNFGCSLLPTLITKMFAWNSGQCSCFWCCAVLCDSVKHACCGLHRKHQVCRWVVFLFKFDMLSCLLPWCTPFVLLTCFQKIMNCVFASLSIWTWEHSCCTAKSKQDRTLIHAALLWSWFLAATCLLKPQCEWFAFGCSFCPLLSPKNWQEQNFLF